MDSNATITTPVNTDCSVLLETRGNSTAPLQGNPDIAGIGVTSAFIASAYICLIITVVCYAHGLLPDALLNDYDREFVRLRSRAKGHWFGAFTSGMMAFSDSQILQGVAVLVAGFANVGSLTVYHWQLIVYMAWMSSNVHLTTLTFLRDYLHEHKGLLYLRLTGMLILLVMLMAAFVPTSSLNWVAAVTQRFDRTDYDTRGWYALNLAMPVHCFWQSPFNGKGAQNNPDLFSGINPDAPFTYLLLIVSYSWKVSSLIRNRPRHSNNGVGPNDTAIALERTWFKRKVLRWLLRRVKIHAQGLRDMERHNSAPNRKMLRTMRITGAEIAFRLSLITYTCSLAAYDFITSFLASIWVLILLLVWGTLEIVNVRSMADKGVHNEEDKWGFGQILSMVLLAAPLIAMINHFMRNALLERRMSPEMEEFLHPSRSIKTKADTKGFTRLKEEEITHPSNPDLDEAPSSSLLHRAQPLQTTTYAPLQEDSDLSIQPPSTLTQYILDTDEPNQTVMARTYCYKSWVFRVMLMLPNIVCILGGTYLFYIEGMATSEHQRQADRKSGESTSDPKGFVWIWGGLVLAAGFAAWIFWAAVGVVVSRLFKRR